MKKILLTVLLVLATWLFIQAQDTTMQQYVGKYKIPEAEMEVIIAFDKPNLTVTFPAGTFTLKKLGVDTFDISEMRDGGSLVFRRNEVKHVIGISVSFNDITLEGKKEN